MPALRPQITREEELLPPVRRYAKRKGFTAQVAELPFFEYRIDLYAVSKPSGDTIAVELKMKNWRRALHQALIYQLCSDYVFIALPVTKAGIVDRAELSKYGVGLILVGLDRRCRLALEAVRSSEVRDYYRRPYVEMLESV
jgi:hypothetical protein